MRWVKLSGATGSEGFPTSLMLRGADVTFNGELQWKSDNNTEVALRYYDSGEWVLQYAEFSSADYSLFRIFTEDHPLGERQWIVADSKPGDDPTEAFVNLTLKCLPVIEPLMAATVADNTTEPESAGYDLWAGLDVDPFGGEWAWTAPGESDDFAEEELLSGEFEANGTLVGELLLEDEFPEGVGVLLPETLVRLHEDGTVDLSAVTGESGDGGDDNGLSAGMVIVIVLAVLASVGALLAHMRRRESALGASQTPQPTMSSATAADAKGAHADDTEASGTDSEHGTDSMLATVKDHNIDYAIPIDTTTKVSTL